ncbi:hypothetical protein [uncultured Tateyamaria sp.]|nr:hypothetical protein [uncultured Tateyamaria sp.]
MFRDSGDANRMLAGRGVCGASAFRYVTRPACLILPHLSSQPFALAAIC